MTTILLIRHGETDWNVERRAQGHGGPGLNERGREQVRATARILAAQPPVQALYSSDLIRTLETAEIIAQTLNLDIHMDARLRERHMGTWQGRLFDEVRAENPGQVEAWRADPLGFRAPGGETYREVAERIAAALDDIAARHPGQRVVAVTHGGPVALMRCMAESLPPAAIRQMHPQNAEILTVEWPMAASVEAWLNTGEAPA